MASRRLFNSKPNYISPSPESFNSVTTGSHFEFDEEDVYDFNESIELVTDKSKLTSLSMKGSRKIDKPDRAYAVTSASFPVDVPDWSKEYCSRNHQNRGSSYDDVDDNIGDDGGIPPHEYFARVRGSSIPFDERIGRKIKRRELRCVRNAIWQKTGFED